MRCSQLQREGYFQPAADCYTKAAAKITVSTDTPERLRVRKWYLYREACKNLEKAAARSDRKEVAAFLRERAVLLLRRALKNKWLPKVRGKRRGRYTRSLLSTFLDKIQYTPLGISTGSKTAAIRVRGYKYNNTSHGSFNHKLRPGHYTVVVTYPQKKAKRRSLVLRPKKPMVVTFVKNPGPPPLSWVGYTVGSTAIVGGGILLVLGISQGVAATDCFNSSKCAFVNGEICYGCQLKQTANNDGAFAAYQNRAILLSILGGTSLATGVILLTVGGLAHARSVRNNVQQRERSVLHLPALSPQPTKIIVVAQ